MRDGIPGFSPAFAGVHPGYGVSVEMPRGIV
jgi:hypothetical protein